MIEHSIFGLLLAITMSFLALWKLLVLKIDEETTVEEIQKQLRKEAALKVLLAAFIVAIVALSLRTVIHLVAVA